MTEYRFLNLCRCDLWTRALEDFSKMSYVNLHLGACRQTNYHQYTHTYLVKN